MTFLTILFKEVNYIWRSFVLMVRKVIDERNMQKRNNLFTIALRIHLTIDSEILNVDQLGDLIYFDTTFGESC